MDFGAFDYVKDHVKIQIGDDLLPNYPLRNGLHKVITEKLDISNINARANKDHDLSPEAIEETERKKIEMRTQNFSEGVDYFRNFKFIDISLLLPDPNGWNYFDKPTAPQMLNLMSSIQSIGIFSPLIVKPAPDGDFYVLCGQSRVIASYNLYKNTQNERYRYVPCFIIEDVDEYFIRTLMIDSNLTYRTISQETFISAIFERYELLRRTKGYRNEMNVAQVIGEEFGISTATVFNYLTLQKLCKEAMTLVCNKELNLQSARMLTRLKLEDQLYILENSTLEDLNTLHKIKHVTKERRPCEKELKQRVISIRTLVPQNTPIRVYVSTHMLSKFLNNVIDFKSLEIPNLPSEYAIKNNHQHFKVKLDKKHMEFYKKANIIDDELLQKVYTRKAEEIKRA